MGSYFSRHLQVFFATLGDIARTPMASINTILVIAITLLLPLLFYVFVQTANTLNGKWQGQSQFTIFFDLGISQERAQLIFDEIQLHPDIALAELLSPEQALDEFKLLSRQGGQAGIDAELEFLGENPLPSSIVVMPTRDSSSKARLQALEQELKLFDGIDSVKLDLAWTDRFQAIVKTLERVALLISGLLILGLVLIVSNSIKMLIFNRRHEIEITKLVGGTHAFVRRPFLYYGSVYGFFGASLALGLTFAAALLVSEPLANLAAAYQSQGFVYQLKAKDVIAVLLIGTGLGWVSARWSVAQHLRHIRPR